MSFWSWWRRLFGRPAEAPPSDPTPVFASIRKRLPVHVPLLPDLLAVRVYAHFHEVGDDLLPCWSYVSDGLRRHGHKELIFTLRPLSDEGKADFPRDVLAFFTDVYRQAEGGHVIEAGAFRRFALPDGFAGQSGLVGLAFVPAQRLTDVNYVDRSLAVLLFTPEESEAAERIGSYRVLTRLGQLHHQYPCPPWSERNRPSVFDRTELEASLLGKAAVLWLPGASCRLQQNQITLRLRHADLAAIAEHLDRLAADAPFALATSPDLEANARLVWRPGQEQVDTIWPEGSDGSVVTGGFVAFLASAEEPEGGRVSEDGFAVWLRPADSARLRQALRTGQSFALPAEGGRTGLILKWDRPGWPVKVQQQLPHQPDEVLRQRLDGAEIGQFSRRVESVVEHYFAGLAPGPGQALTIVWAVRPGRLVRFWLEFNPGGLPAEIGEELQRRLNDMHPPAVRSGPVSCALHCALWGGTGKADAFAFIPREWQAACREGENLVIPDDVLARVWQE